jgi:hypothetical protein
MLSFAIRNPPLHGPINSSTKSSTIYTIVVYSRLLPLPIAVRSQHLLSKDSTLTKRHLLDSNQAREPQKLLLRPTSVSY